MANLKISQLTGATTPLAGSEEVPIVQSGSTKKVTVSNLTAGRAVTASTVGAGTTVPASYTLATNGPLYFASASFPGVPSAGTGAAYGSAANGIVFWGNGSTYDLLLGNKNADECISVATGQRAVKFWDNAIIGTAAKGINFTANSAAAGMTSQLLNWYEEGTWTPAYSATSGAFTTLTYSAQTGTYVRIGKVVYIKGEIRTSNVVLGTAAGILRITGLPFTPSGSEAAIGVNLFIRFNLGTSIRITSATLDTVGIYFETSLSNDTGANQVAATEMTTGATASRNYVRFSGFYNV